MERRQSKAGKNNGFKGKREGREERKKKREGADRRRERGGEGVDRIA